MIIRKLFINEDDFNKNSSSYNKLVIQIQDILEKNVVGFFRTGSTATGIAIGSSDLDIACLTGNVQLATTKLREYGFECTGQYPHFENWTQLKNHVTHNLDCDVKIYFDKKEFDRLKLAISNYVQKIDFVERYWVIAQKQWYCASNQLNAYNRVKTAFYVKHGIYNNNNNNNNNKQHCL